MPLGEMTPETSATLAVVALLVAFVALAIVLLLAWRQRGRRKRGKLDPAELSPAVERALWRLDELAKRVDGFDGRLPVVEDQGKRALQSIGVVRFNPFEDTGGNQSFALAMLDSKRDGIVVSSLHSRQSTRLYLKPIVGGKSETALSDEEAEALRKAGAG